MHVNRISLEVKELQKGKEKAMMALFVHQEDHRGVREFLSGYISPFIVLVIVHLGSSGLPSDLWLYKENTVLIELK